MMEDARLDRLIGLVRNAGALEPPRVDPVDPEIRSGATFLFRDPLKRGVPAEDQELLKSGIEKGGLIGTIVIEWGYDVPNEKGKRFRRWLLDNEADIVAAQPEGVRYKGTYAVFSSTERESGQYRTIWAYDSFAALQDLGERLADEGSRFAQLVEQLNSFRDRERGAAYSQQVLQPAAAVHRL
jgi:hypothetical protein